MKNLEKIAMLLDGLYIIIEQSVVIIKQKLSINPTANSTYQIISSTDGCTCKNTRMVALFVETLEKHAGFDGLSSLPAQKKKRFNSLKKNFAINRIKISNKQIQETDSAPCRNVQRKNIWQKDFN